MPEEISEPVLISTWYVYGDALVGSLPDGDRGNAIVPISCFGDSVFGLVADSEIINAVQVSVAGDSVIGSLTDGDPISGISDTYFTRPMRGDALLGILSDAVCVVYPDLSQLSIYFQESDYSQPRSTSSAPQVPGSVESDYQLT